MRKVSLLALSLLLTGLLVVPSLAAAEEPKYGGTLIYGLEGDPQSIDPNKALTSVEGKVFPLFCDNLVEPDKNFAPHPALAESWEMLDDGRVWVFHLRKGVKFHNGREFTAEDVKWNIERMAAPETAGGFKTIFEIVESVEAVDPYTARVNMKKPFPYFIESLCGRILNPLFIAPESLNEEGNVLHPIGTGPFEFVEWVSGDHILVKKFKDHWREGIPYLDAINMKIVVDDITRMNALKAGDVDVTDGLPYAEVARLLKEGHPGYQLAMEGTIGAISMFFNVSKPPFNDVRVRQAFALGVDRKEINQGVYFGYGEEVNQPAVTTTYWYCDVPITPRDPAKAKALLAEAGYPDGLAFSISTSTTFFFHKATAEIVQAQLSECGFKVNLDLSDWPTLINKMVSMKFEVASCGIGIEADPATLYSAYLIPGSTYHWLTGNAYDNPKLTELLTAAYNEPDKAKRKELYTQAIRIIIDEVPFLYLVNGVNTFGWRDDVKGYEPHPVVFFAYANGGLPYAWLDR